MEHDTIIIYFTFSALIFFLVSVLRLSFKPKFSLSLKASDPLLSVSLSLLFVETWNVSPRYLSCILRPKFFWKTGLAYLFSPFSTLWLWSTHSTPHFSFLIFLSSLDNTEYIILLCLLQTWSDNTQRLFILHNCDHYPDMDKQAVSNPFFLFWGHAWQPKLSDKIFTL